MSLILTVLPYVSGAPEAHAVAVDGWVVLTPPTEPSRIFIASPQTPQLCRLVSVQGPAHQRSLAAQTLAEATPRTRSDDLAAAAAAGAEAATEALTTDAGMLDRCQVSVSQVAGAGSEVALATVGDVYAYLMTSGYAAPEGPPPGPGLPAGYRPPDPVVSVLRLGPGEWLLISTRPLEALDAPIEFPPGQGAPEYLRQLTSRRNEQGDGALVVAYLPTG